MTGFLLLYLFLCACASIAEESAAPFAIGLLLVIGACMFL
jgi:hypothetical protein